MSRQTGSTKRRTTPAVYLWDRTARAVITVGGMGVLAAVLGICVYLLATVLPLFRGGSAEIMYASQTPPRERRALMLGEYGQAIVTLDADGTLYGSFTRTGNDYFTQPVITGRKVSVAARSHNAVAVALDDGSLRVGEMAASTSLLAPDEINERMRRLPIGAEASRRATETRPVAQLERIGEDQFRQTLPTLTLKEATPANTAGPFVRLDLYDDGSGSRVIAALRGDGSGTLGSVRTITPLGGDEPTEQVAGTDFRIDIAGRGVPEWLFVTADGASVLALWKEGTLERLALVGDGVRAAESLRVVGAGDRATAAAMLLGGQTLVVGDSRGVVRGWEAARDPSSSAPDALRLVCSREHRVDDAPVAALAASERERLVAVCTEPQGAAPGAAVVLHMTSDKEVACWRETLPGPNPRLCFSGRGDVLLAVTDGGGYEVRRIAPAHADVSARSLFAPLRYEGELTEKFIYQSSAGSESAEVKLSLIPLIFGTLKATAVAMLVAIPLAVLGAIYTSEFMHADVRRVVKPVVELMASLPSVVLGFIAAIVVAPFIGRWLAQVLVGLTLTPVLLGALAHVWQLVPRRRAATVTRRGRLALIASALAASGTIAVLSARPITAALFQPTRVDQQLADGQYHALPEEQWPAWVGQRATMSPMEERRLRQVGLGFRDGGVVAVRDEVPAAAGAVATATGLRVWLDGRIGNAYPGWLLALALPCLIAVFLLQQRIVSRERFESVLGSSHAAMGIAELVRYGVSVVAGIGVAAAASWALTRAGLDPRDSIFGPFSERNALVVGVIMGFAVIPIIYTISEDALRSVPNHLRSASLGVGATPWQTAVRVVLPTAASGVFSAVMIGLGRAVGETMIVLMATGNTPEMSANIFSGFRTLAADIAVELPEAVRGGTHFRVLFLCGLVLFVMTLLVNTTAEVVRQRFRKRNAAL